MVKNIKRKDRLKLGLLKLGEVAEEVRTLPSTVRYYSNLGLIQVSDYTQGKYRLFRRDETVAKILRIKELQEKGMTLEDIRKKFSAKGFSLIEIVVASLTLVIIALAIGVLFYLHGKFIKDFLSKTEKGLKYQIAVEHMAKNIRNSTWIEVADSNTVKLQSHSNPHVREYKFENNELKYKEDDGFYTVIADKIDLANYTGRPDTPVFFKGEGEERSNNRFQKVRIEFAEKTDDPAVDYTDKDIFYVKTEVISKESWDLIYVDPNGASSVETGSKQQPFRNFNDGVRALPPYNETYIPSPDRALIQKILVMSGTHAFSGETNIPSNVYFGANSEIIINPGAVLEMLQQVAFVVTGKFQFDGTSGNKIFITCPIAHPEARWYKIFLMSPQANQSFTYLDIGKGDYGFYVNSPQPTQPIEVNVAYNFVRATTRFNGFWIKGARNLGMYQNLWEQTGYYAAGIENTNAPPGDITHLVYNNTVTMANGEGFYFGMGVNSNQKLFLEIYNNVLKRTGYFGDSLAFYSFGEGHSITRAHDNVLKSTSISVVYLVKITDNNSNPLSNILIDNNDLLMPNSHQSSKAVYVTSSIAPVEISRNNIQGGESWGVPYQRNLGLWKPDISAPIFITSSKNCTIKNNRIYNNSGCIIRVSDSQVYGYEGYVNNVALKNNLIYKTGSSTSLPYVLFDCNIARGDTGIFENNVLYNVGISASANVDVRNSIIWGTLEPSQGYVDSGNGTLSRITYSDIKGVTPDLGQHIISSDPLFINAAAYNYHLQSIPAGYPANSPCIDTGNPDAVFNDTDRTRNDMGGYGGPDSFLDDTGAPPESTIGVQW